MRDIGRWGGGTAVAASMLVMNVATYAYSLVAARLLGPTAFGEFSAVMAVLIIANVLALGVQATAARRLSQAAPAAHAVVIAATRLAAIRAALGVLIAMLALIPLGHALMDWASWVTPVALAVAAALLTLIGGQAGVLQGGRRWSLLTAQQLTFALGRLGLGWAALWWQPSTASATVAVALGLVPVAMVGSRAFDGSAPRPADPGTAPLPSAHPGTAPPREVRASLRESLHDAHALLAFFAFANLDPILLRAAVDEQRAGLVAGGLILTKAALFLPQFVLIVAFPGMASATHRGPLLRVLAAVTVLGLGATLGVLALPDLALAFIGGPAYAQIADSLWLFTLLGTALALLQVAVYGELAGQARRLSPLLWLAVAGAVVLVLLPATAPAYLGWRLAGVVLVLTVGLTGVLSAPRRARSGRRPR